MKELLIKKYKKCILDTNTIRFVNAIISAPGRKEYQTTNVQYDPICHMLKLGSHKIPCEVLKYKY